MAFDDVPDSRIASFFTFLSAKMGTGAPPPPFGSWPELDSALRGLTPDALTGVFDAVEATFTFDTSDENYDRWSTAKRAAANQAAAGALRDALASGGVASPEQIRAIQAYTGFGGFKEVGILPPEYPAAYVQASKEWVQVAAMGGAVSDRARAIFERVKDQYFTRLDVCRAMHQIVARVAPTARTYLEPSAGIGRFVRVAPAGVSWHLVEMDDLLADMLQVMYPNAVLHRGVFEQFAVGARKTPTIDVVIGNPPYGKRPVEMMNLDLRGIRTAEDYFNIAGGAVLKPGGTLCYIVPLSTLTRAPSVDVRTRMLQGCAFRGAALVPSGAFPNVADGTFAITVWTRRAQNIRPEDFDEREKKVAAGAYLSLDEARSALCGGEWRSGWRGDYLHGAPDFSRVSQLWFAPAPAGVDVRKPVEVVSTDASAAPEPPTQGEIVEAAEDAQAALGHQIAAWILSIARDPAGAEERRNAIRTLVVESLAQNGNPHPKGPPGLRAVVTPEGGLEEILTQPVGPRTTLQTPPSPDDPAALVSYWCESRGYADLDDFPPGTTVETVLASPDVFVDIRPEGPVFFSRWAYFTGNPNGLLVACDRVLSNQGLAPVIRDRVTVQKAAVLQFWTGSKTLPEMDVTPRSPFVPVEALQEWINHLVLPKFHDGPGFVLKVENGLINLEHNETYSAASDWTNLGPLYWLLGYYNRSSLVDRVDQPEAPQIKVYGEADSKAAAAIDEDFVAKFREWVAGSSWVTAIETEYNARFAPVNMSMIPSGPIGLAGQNPGVVLHPHQNQAVRRCSLGGKARPFLFALDVGGGKTMAGSATALRWRQTGTAQRILIAVPNSVLGKWYDDGKKLAPSAKIGLVGISVRKGRDGSIKSVEDTPDMRAEKWLRFAAGAYDYMLVGHQTFVNDLEPDPEAVEDVMIRVAWAQRGASEKVSKFRRSMDKIEGIKADIRRVELINDEHEWDRAFAATKGVKKGARPGSVSWEERRREVLAKLANDLLKAEAALDAMKEEVGVVGTDRDVATVQQIIREAVERKLYRPSLGKAGAEDEGEDEGEDEEGSEGEGGEGGEVRPKKDPHVPRPGLVLWSQVGVDAMVVDEAHQFKNLWFPKNKIEYAGKGEDDPLKFKVKRAWDMFIKTRLVHRRAGGVGGVMFLTATPMTNSPLELYSLMDMCNPQAFENAGVYDKEQFIDRYWNVRAQDIPRADGSIQPGPALTGFKNLDEMLAVISGSFDRISTADLIRKGWIRALPKAEPEKILFQRDPIQTMLLRNLTSIYVGWIKTQGEDDGNGEKQVAQTSACGLTQMIDPVIWAYEGGTLVPRVTSLADGMVVKDRAGRHNCPEILIKSEDNPRAKMAQGTFRLVWMSMLDKIATSPMLLLAYAQHKSEHAVELQARYAAWEGYREARDAWKNLTKAQQAVTPRPKAPKGKPPQFKDVVTMTVARAIMPYLNLEQVEAYYKARPVVPKIAELARRIADNVEQTSLLVHTSPRGVVAAGVERLSISGDPDDPTTKLLGQDRYIREAMVLLDAAGIRYDAPKVLGRCGHVIFCDPQELYDQIKDAIVAATNGGIPRSRIVILPKNKALRLGISKAFNGADATSLTPEILPDYDVIIGSTEIMAEGIDLQRRSCAVHHIDLPWSPAKLHQRNGRAVRQGNIMGRVDVIYYMTEKSYDAVRFDKIAKKALWWDAMFSGQGSTSNPLAEDEAGDLDEIILSMVVEDPEILRECMTQIRAEREAKRVIEEREKATKEWIVLNAAFARVRATADTQRRAALYGVAARKLQNMMVVRGDLIPREAAMQLPERNVALDVETGQFFPAGAFLTRQTTFGPQRVKITRMEVREKGFSISVRPFGEPEAEGVPEPSLFNEGYNPTQPWTPQEEFGRIAESIVTNHRKGLARLAYPEPDLREWVYDIWLRMLEYIRKAQGQRQVIWDLAGKSPVLDLGENRVGLLIPQGAMDPYLDFSPLLNSAKIDTVRRVLPLSDPEAKTMILSAVREDRLWLCTKRYRYGHGQSIVENMRQARMPINTWTILLENLIPEANRSIGAALKFRASVTLEQPSTTEGSTPAALEL